MFTGQKPDALTMPAVKAFLAKLDEDHRILGTTWRAVLRGLEAEANAAKPAADTEEEGAKGGANDSL